MAVDQRAALRRAIGGPIDEVAPEICKICSGEALLFDHLDFGKSCTRVLFPLGYYGVDIPYYQCRACHFTFTPAFDRFSPSQWRQHIYNQDYVTVDPAYRYERPAANAFTTEAYLKVIGGPVSGLDFGGGDGSAAWLLRRRGWAYDSVDPFDGEDHLAASEPYGFCTAYEVFEHLPDPHASLVSIVNCCSSERLMIMIGTNVLDGAVTEKSGLDWWYAAPRNGHISLYSRQALRILAGRSQLDYFSLGRNLHFLTRNYSHDEVFRIAVEGKLRRILSRGKLPEFETALRGAQLLSA